MRNGLVGWLKKMKVWVYGVGFAISLIGPYAIGMNGRGGEMKK